MVGRERLFCLFLFGHAKVRWRTHPEEKGCSIERSLLATFRRALGVTVPCENQTPFSGA